jgi:hypothetical protein
LSFLLSWKFLHRDTQSQFEINRCLFVRVLERLIIQGAGNTQVKAGRGQLTRGGATVADGRQAQGRPVKNPEVGYRSAGRVIRQVGVRTGKGQNQEGEKKRALTTQELRHKNNS